uniref:Uncharacterized protein n=1 Tax=viral metagenome TaxID=1070528 RepID=A0A6M3LDS1_9ZZZZ
MKTVRDIVTALACDGATVVSILGALPTYILDAIVIGCEECGGAGLLAKPSGDFPDPGSTFISCPSCHGKSFVVSKEAREAARRVVHIMYHATGAESAEAAEHLIDDATNDIARALLGGEVYEATEVGVVQGADFVIKCGGADLSPQQLVRHGDRIAVLKQGGE